MGKNRSENEGNRTVYRVKNREQVELLTDPLGLPILVAMNRDEWLTAEELSDELGEDRELLYDYLSKMDEADMLEKKVEENEEYFSKKAIFYSVGKMFSDLPKNIDDHWIFGIIQHLKGDFKDLLEPLQSYSNLTEGFEDLGYPGEEALDFLIRQIHLSEEQLVDFNEELRELINKYENMHAEETNSYDISVFVKPYLPAFRKKAAKNRKEESK